MAVKWKKTLDNSHFISLCDIFFPHVACYQYNIDVFVISKITNANKTTKSFFKITVCPEPCLINANSRLVSSSFLLHLTK